MALRRWSQEDEDRELSERILALDDDPWSRRNIGRSSQGRIPDMFFELMQRIRFLEAEVQKLKAEK